MKAMLTGFALQTIRMPVVTMTLFQNIEHKDRSFVDMNDHGKCSERRREFWERQFADLESAIYPREPSAAKPGPRNILRREIADIRASRNGPSFECVVQLSWTIVQARYAGSTDVVFGATVSPRTSSGQSATASSIPSGNVLPIRVRVSWERTIEESLFQLEQQAAEMDAFVQDDRSSIARLKEKTQQACLFQTVLNVNAETPLAGSGLSNGDAVLYGSMSGRMEPEATYVSDDEALIVNVRTVGQNLEVEFDYDSSVLEKIQARRLMGQLETVVRQVGSQENGDMALGSVQTASATDVQVMWAWNVPIPDPPAICVHDILHNVAQSSRIALAVDAWDGRLTYGELDDLSTLLAHEIVGRSLPSNTIISLIFDKTLWCTVAMLAVMKAGAAATLLPASHPEARLRQMIEQVDSKLVLTSTSAQALAGRLTSSSILVVDSDGIRSLSKDQDARRVCLPKVDPLSPLCVLFTSGSSGIPKAAILSHRNMVAALVYQKEAHQLNQSSRYLDLAPNTGDAIWMNTLLPLSHGACLCIASDDQRLGTDMLSLSKFKATYALVAPTMADLLFELNLLELKTVVFGGEPLSSSHIAKWRARGTQILNCYGPAECTPFIALNDVSNYTGDTVSIGRPIACCAWLVDPESGDSLVGIGMVGELWLESPLVGEGYLNDRLRTEAAFVSDPPWLLRGTSGDSGRRARLYNTGDLVRYNSDGTLVVIGRKGTMLTMRGQRLEPGDVEHHLKQELGASSALQVAVEIVVPPGRVNQRLVGFIDARLLDRYATDVPGAGLQAKIEHLRDRLSQTLPYYMVPTDILPVEAIPSTATTKVDRRSLRKIGESRLASPLAFKRE